MANIDPEQERQRLSKLYADMSEEELRKIAGDFVDLTDVGRQVLADEIKRRGSDIPLTDAVAVDQMELRPLVTIRQFRDLSEGLLAKSMLDSAGIECFLADDNLIRMNWFISNFVGGLKLQVNPEDTETANEVLNQPIPEDFAVEGIGEYQQPRCPKCHSVDITFEAMNKAIGLTSAYIVGVPVPIPKNAWKCQSCGCRWQDSNNSSS